MAEVAEWDLVIPCVVCREVSLGGCVIGSNGPLYVCDEHMVQDLYVPGVGNVAMARMHEVVPLVA